MDGNIHVAIVFAGLILFVTNPDTGRVTHAVLADGRAGHHHHGSALPMDDPECAHLIRDDFDHHPMIWWQVGDTSHMIIGGALLDDSETSSSRGEISLSWYCGEIPCKPSLLSETFSCSGGSAGATRSPGACQVGPPAAELGRLPSDGQYMTPADERRSFSWIPHLADLGIEETVAPSVIGGWGGDVPSSVFARVRLDNGEISSGDFGWMFDDRGPVIPRLRYLAGSDGRTPVRRAAAEAAIWEPDVHKNATHLAIVRKPFGEGTTAEDDEIIEKLPLDGRPLQVVITNSPRRRCLGRPHPARRVDIASVHFEMLYDLIAPDGGSDHSSHVAPARRRIPRPPERITEGGFLRRRTVVPYFPWWPRLRMSGNAPPVTSSGTAALPDSPPFVGDVAEAVGTKERPICIPASGNG